MMNPTKGLYINIASRFSYRRITYCGFSWTDWKSKRGNSPFLLAKSRTWDSRDARRFQQLETIENIRSFLELLCSVYRSRRQLNLREGIHSTCYKHFLVKCKWVVVSTRIRKKGNKGHDLPSVKLQTTFLQLLNPSVIICALRLSDSRMPLLQQTSTIRYDHSLVFAIGTIEIGDT